MLPFQSTVAPNASNIARSGTSVRPSIIIGGWSKFTSCPFAFTVINAEFKALPMDNEGTLIEYRESDN